jgi:hypothetical protein
VTATSPFRVTLELEPDADPIRGVLEDERGAHPFDGWLALTQLLEESLQSARPGDDRL